MRLFNKEMFVSWRGYLVAIGAVALATWIKYLAQPDIISTDRSIIYILAIVPTAIFFGLGPAIFAIALSLLAFDYFFIPPIHTFRQRDIHEIPLLLIFLIVGLVVSYLAADLRHKNRIATKEIAAREKKEAELQSYRNNLEDLVRQRTAELENVNLALRQSEERLKRSEEIAHLGSRELDIVNDHLSWSDEVYKIFGFQPQEFGATYEAFLETVHPDDRTTVDAAYTSSVREGRDSYEIKHRVVRKSNGEIRYVHEKCTHVRNESGKIIRSIGMVQDITEQKKSEDKNRQLSAIVESSDDAIIGKTVEGIITSWNKGAEKIYGYTEPEVIGKSISLLVPPTRKNEFLRFLDRMRNGEYVKVFETIHLKKDGNQITTTLAISPILDEEGKVVGSSTIAHDLTQHKKVEDQLRQRTEELETIMDTAPAAILLAHDPKCQYITGNRAANALYEAKAGDNLAVEAEPGKSPPRRRFFRKGKPLTTEELPMQIASVNNIDVQGAEFDVMLPSGKLLSLWGSASPLQDKDGRVRGVVAAYLDITGRKKSEDDLTHYAVELEAANKELESFSYSVSHDLRAPLRALSGFSDAISEEYSDKLDGKGKGYLDQIRAAGRRMSDLINDLLKLSRLSRSELHLEDVNLSEIAQSILAELKNTQPDRTAEFIIPSDIIVNGDKSLLTIALQNLLGNSWKFTGKSPKVLIEFGVSDRSEEKVYFVKDNGAGFNMQYGDKLFQPFQRLHSSKDYEGTGIGLAIVQMVIRRHGGRVWAESEQGKGATFYFTLG